MKEGYGPVTKNIVMKGMGWVLGHPKLYRFAGASGRWVMRNLPFLINNKIWNPWYKQRNLPVPPKESFREWYLKKEKQ
jgi:L-lactate dehydrogenase complex protein LldF